MGSAHFCIQGGCLPQILLFWMRQHNAPKYSHVRRNLMINPTTIPRPSSTTQNNGRTSPTRTLHGSSTSTHLFSRKRRRKSPPPLGLRSIKAAMGEASGLELLVLPHAGGWDADPNNTPHARPPRPAPPTRAVSTTRGSSNPRNPPDIPSLLRTNTSAGPVVVQASRLATAAPAPL